MRLLILSTGRALEAPQIRRIFSSSPRDPRYHMLEHLSPKFKMPPMEREPRAALILNRFTRNLSIMFATNAVSSILGLEPDEIKDKAFYEFIQENCLQDAIQCLESAKANESIAYLRFWYRDPRVEGSDSREDGDDGGERSVRSESDSRSSSQDVDSSPKLVTERMDLDDGVEVPIKVEAEDEDMLSSTVESHGNSPSTGLTRRTGDRSQREPVASFELEAVVSCTSDGLVVVLRKARPPIPPPHLPLPPPLTFENGLFAAPWGQRPIEPYFPPELLYTFRPPLLPQYMPLRECVKAAGGPPIDQLMRSIRDVAVFAWALTGINGNLANYGHGLPGGSAQPPDGLPVWDQATNGTSAYRPADDPQRRRWNSSDDKGKAPVRPEPSYGSHALPSGPTSAELPPQNYAREYQPQLAQASRDNYGFGGRSESLPWSQLPPSYQAGCGFQQQTAFSSGYNGSSSRAHFEQNQLPSQAPPPLPRVNTPPMPGFPGITHESWADPSSSRDYSPGYSVPSSQAPSPDEPSKPFRYEWQ